MRSSFRPGKSAMPDTDPGVRDVTRVGYLNEETTHCRLEGRVFDDEPSFAH